MHITAEEGGGSSASVTNTLRNVEAPPPVPIPTLGLPLLWLMSALVAALGLGFRRRGVGA